jgi:NCS2 family nucleobase:cation symporter-2
MLDARKILVVGISLILGLSVDMLPGAYTNVPDWLSPVFSSSLSLATVVVILLNLITRIGIAQKQVFKLRPGVDSGETIYLFFDNKGREWGAREEIISRAVRALTEFFEVNEIIHLTQNDIEVTASFDEFNLDISIRYEGQSLAFPAERPSPEEVIADDMALSRLAANIIHNTVDRISCEDKKGTTHMAFHFDH